MPKSNKKPRKTVKPVLAWGVVRRGKLLPWAYSPKNEIWGTRPGESVVRVEIREVVR